MSNETLIITRHEAPTSMDELAYGTACKVIRDKDYDLYVQISKHDKEKPNWLYIGTFDGCCQDDIINEEIENIVGKQ